MTSFARIKIRLTLLMFKEQSSAESRTSVVSMGTENSVLARSPSSFESGSWGLLVLRPRRPAKEMPQNPEKKEKDRQTKR